MVGWADVEAGSVYFWGRSLAGEMGQSGYVKFAAPTCCALLQGRRVARVLAHKRASVCFERRPGMQAPDSLIVLGRFEHPRRAGRADVDGSAFEVRCPEPVAVAVLLDAGLALASGRLCSADAGQLFVLRHQQLQRVAAPGPVRFLAGVRDELLVFFDGRLLRCKFDPESFEQQLAAAPVCSIDFEPVFQKPLVACAASGCFSAPIEIRRRHSASSGGSLVLQEAGLELGSHEVSLFVETLRRVQVAGAFPDTQSPHAPLEVSLLSTLRNASSGARSGLPADAPFPHKQSLSLTGAETKRRGLDRSRLTPERNHGLPREPSLQNLALLNLTRRDANDSLARAEEFQARLKEELKKIEQKHRQQAQLAASFAGSCDSLEQPSTLTAGGARGRLLLEHVLDSWPEDRTATEDHETTRTRKLNLIRSLIHDRQPPAGPAPDQRTALAGSGGSLDKERKFAQIKEHLSRIEVIPSELVSRKDTLDYELSDNDPSDTSQPELPDALPGCMPATEQRPLPLTNTFSRDRLQVIYPTPADPPRATSELQHLRAVARPFEQSKPKRKAGQEPADALVAVPAERFDPRQARRDTEAQVCGFLILLDKKLALVSRVRRRVQLQQFFALLKQVYSTAVEREKTEQSHAILKLLSQQYLEQCVEHLRDAVLQIRFLVTSAAGLGQTDMSPQQPQPSDLQDRSGELMSAEAVSHTGSGSERSSPSPAACDAREAVPHEWSESVGWQVTCVQGGEQAEAPEETARPERRLDEFRVRRLLIITKTLLFQKLYLLSHEFFASLRSQSEQKKRRTKLFLAKLEAAMQRQSRRDLKYCVHRVLAFGKIRGLLGAFARQVKHEYFAALRQFSRDRSLLLACTASEISMVRDESLEISQRRPDSRYHLARYIGSHFAQPDAPRADSARARARGPLPQNTLEEIRHELSELHSKKIDEVSAISRRSDGPSRPEPRASSEREPPARLFANDKLKTLACDWRGLAEPPRLPPARSKSESFPALGCLAPADRLIDIQLAPPSPGAPELSAGQLSDRLAPAGAIMFETFKKASAAELDPRKSARFGENSAPDTHPVDPVRLAPAAFDRLEQTDLDQSARHLGKLSELFKKKTPGQEAKNTELRFFAPGALPDPAEPLPRPTDSPARHDPPELSWPKEPSDDVAWARSHFSQGLNFLDKPPAAPQPNQAASAKGGEPKAAASRPASKERVSESPKPQSAARLAPEARQDAPSQKKHALLGREGKPPLAYSKTQESFRSFFKKLDSDKKDRDRPESSSRAPADGLEPSPLDVTGAEPRATRGAPLPQSRDRTPRVSKGKPLSLTPSNKLKSAKHLPGPAVQSSKELPARPASGSLADRLERIIHDKQAPQPPKNPIRAELSQQSSMFSPDVTGVFRHTISSDKLRSSNQKQLQPAESLADRISASSIGKKPAIKIRSELNNNRSIRPKASPNTAQTNAAQKSHPHLPVRPEQPHKTPDTRALLPKGGRGSKETSKEKLLQSAKSVRTVSGRSEASKKLDTSNEAFRERFAAARGEPKKASHSKPADLKRAYQSSK